MEDGGLSEADKLNKKTLSPSEISNLFNLISQRKQQEFNEFTGQLPKSNNLVEDLIRESKQELPSDPFAPKPVLKAGQSTKAQKTIEQMRAEVEANRRAADILKQNIQGIAPRKGSEKPYAGRSTLFPEGVMRDVAEAAYRDIGQSIVPAQRQWTPSVTIGRQPSYISPVNVETVLGEAGSALDMPSQLAGEAAFRATGSPALATAAAYGSGMIGPEGYVKGSKALANEAAYRIHQAMTKGEGPLAGALAGVAPRPLITWHGTPHRFPPTEKNPLGEFDPTKIGTGEGAQAYGYGHYLAEAPGTAHEYRARLAGRPEIVRLKVGNKAIGPYNQFDYSPKTSSTKENIHASLIEDLLIDESDLVAAHSSGGDKAIQKIIMDNLDRRIKDYADEWPEGVPYAKQLKDELSKRGSVSLKMGEKPGSFYAVNLPDEAIAKMLDWDKPLSEQPKIQKFLKGTDYEIGISNKEAEKIADMRLRQEANDWADETGGDPVDYINNANWEKYVDDARKESGKIDSETTGAELHRMIMMDEGYSPGLFDPENYQIPTSERLRSMGIPGIKYLDQSSRAAGEGTRNFVVFPGGEDLMNIVGREKKGGVVHKSEGGITSDDLIVQETPL